LKQNWIADQICGLITHWLFVVGFGPVSRRLVAKLHPARAAVSQPAVRLATSPVVARS
jgi:hypothetical protein